MVSTLLRFGVAMVVAVMATFAVFWMMQSLVSSGGSVLNDQNHTRIQNFVMAKADDDVQTKERMPRKPPETMKEPAQPQMPKPDVARADAKGGMDVGGFQIGADLSVDAGLAGGAGEAASDGEFLPIVKVAPNYPRRAAAKGIEGYVVVEFTVTALGTVDNPVVVEADPVNVFDREALAAVRKFKYKPKVENGQPVAVPGVRNIIRFELEKNGRKG